MRLARECRRRHRARRRGRGRRSVGRCRRARSCMLLRRSIRCGHRQLARERAMLRARSRGGSRRGSHLAAHAVTEGADAVLLGEIGIGNTTAAAAADERAARRPARATSSARARASAATCSPARSRSSKRPSPLHRPDRERSHRRSFGRGRARDCGARRVRARSRAPARARRSRRVRHQRRRARGGSHGRGRRPVPLGVARIARAGGSHRARASRSRAALRSRSSPRRGDGRGARVARSARAVDVHLSMATFATAGIVGRAGAVVRPGTMATQLERDRCRPRSNAARDHDGARHARRLARAAARIRRARCFRPPRPQRGALGSRRFCFFHPNSGGRLSLRRSRARVGACARAAGGRGDRRSVGGARRVSFAPRRPRLGDDRVGASMLITGALHEDGLADTSDALGGRA